MSLVYISYRRVDSTEFVRRVYDYLAQKLGEDNVFLDTKSLKNDETFAQRAPQEIESIRVLLVVIGPLWVNDTDSAGRRKLDNRQDWHRWEIETALGRGIEVIPVLIGGAHLASVDLLPDKIKSLADRPAVEFHSESDFQRDISRLLTIINKAVENHPGDVSKTQRQRPAQPDRQQRVSQSAAQTDIADKPHDTGIARDNLNMRSAPNANSPILRLLTKGTVITIVDRASAPWLHVQTADSVEGYVHEDYVEIQQPPPALGGTPPGNTDDPNPNHDPTPTPPKTGSRNELTNDVVRQEDQLGFQVYVDAFVALIRAYQTSLPLTIGIYGSWGMGKSFLLDNIYWSIQDLQDKDKQDKREALEKLYPQHPDRKGIRQAWSVARWRVQKLGIRTRYNATASAEHFRQRIDHIGAGLQGCIRRIFLAETRNPANPATVHIYTVRFNAWEYSATEVIWPGLVRRIMDGFEKGMGTRKRVILSIRKVWRNLRQPSPTEKKNRMILLMMLLGIVVFILLGAQILNIPLHLEDILKILLVPVLVGGLFKTIIEFVRPMGEWITNLFQEREYGKYLDQMVDTSDDLKFLQRQLRDDERVLIIIDDLDRCEPEKAVQMLQAIKLLLNFERFIVVMGIDARIITRAIEEHYKGVLGAAGASGYEYLDKIVQIPFRIPEPSPSDIEHFLNLQLSPKDGKPPTVPPPPPTQTPGASTPAAGDTNLPAPPSPSPEIVTTTPKQATPEEAEAVSTSAFEQPEIEAFQALSPFLRPNPRHIKRMTNVYRLVRALATGRATVMRQDPATVINWVLLCGQWPYTVYMMLEAHETLTDYPDEDPLTYLYELAKKDTRFSVKKQKKLDFDPDILDKLLVHLSTNDSNGEGWMSWDELKELRGYTINFNPAIEAELAIEEEKDKNPPPRYD